MQLLMLNYEYPPVGGGAAPVSRELAETMVERGHEVDVVTMAYDDLPATENGSGPTVHRVRALRSSASMCRPHELLSYLPTGFLRSRQLLSEREYDLVHAHFIVPTGLIAYAMDSLYDVPYVVTAHGTDVPGYNPDRFGALHRAIEPAWRRVAEDAAVIASPSEHLGRLIRSQSEKAPVEVIPNGFDYRAYDPHREKAERILVTSRLFERKGIQHFLDALAQVDTDWDVVVTGEGPYRDALERRADRLDVDVTFAGWVDRETLTELLETSAVYVFPSCYENCPVAVQEAMAAGAAVVASKYSGTSEVARDAGVLVDPRDTSAFAATLERVLSDPDERARLQRRSRACVERRFDWGRIGDRYETVYRALQ